MSRNLLIDHYQCPSQYSAALPFEVNEVIENLRLERYLNGKQSRGSGRQLVRNIYYAFRPLMGVAFRKHLQRAYLKGWQDIRFPHWPLDRTVESIFESSVTVALESRGESEMPFTWFWPDGHSGCVILTHDIETARGR